MNRSINIVEVDGINYIAIDKEGFDWGLEAADIKKLQFACANDPHMTESYIGNIKNHFVECFSEFVGKKMTLSEINDCIEQGFIEV